MYNLSKAISSARFEDNEVCAIYSKHRINIKKQYLFEIILWLRRRVWSSRPVLPWAQIYNVHSQCTVLYCFLRYKIIHYCIHSIIKYFITVLYCILKHLTLMLRYILYNILCTEPYSWTKYLTIFWLKKTSSSLTSTTSQKQLIVSSQMILSNGQCPSQGSILAPSTQWSIND